MRKAALQTVNAIDNQSGALLLLADKLNHALKLWTLAFGRAFDDAKDLYHFQIATGRILLQIAKLCLKRMTGFLFGNGITALLEDADERTDEVGRVRLREQFKRLTLPTEMGERFQVMGFSRDVDLSAAFAMGDLTWRL